MSSGGLAIIAAVALLGLVVLVVLLTRRGDGGGGSAEQELRRMCRGDREQAERLIAGQRQRNPSLSREDAAQRAVRAWRRDLR